MHRVFLNLTDFFPKHWARNKNVPPLYLRHFSCLIFAPPRLLLAGIPSSVTVCEELQRKTPEKPQLKRERERESVCTMARATRLPRCPADPVPHFQGRKREDYKKDSGGSWEGAAGGSPQRCWRTRWSPLRTPQFLCPLTSQKAGDRNLKPLFSLLNFLGQLFRCFCVWFPLFFDTHMTL